MDYSILCSWGGGGHACKDLFLFHLLCFPFKSNNATPRINVGFFFLLKSYINFVKKTPKKPECSNKTYICCSQFLVMGFSVMAVVVDLC